RRSCAGGSGTGRSGAAPERQRRPRRPPLPADPRPLPAPIRPRWKAHFRMSSILGVPVDAAYHLVSGFTTVLTPALGGAAAVAAIVLFTVAARLILMPLSLRGLRGQAAQARLAPQLQDLRKRYAKQPERLQREMTALYKREGTSVFAGLTPILLQWPLLSVMYLLFRSGQVGGKPNTLLTRDLFGVPLGSHWLDGAGPVSTHGLVFLGIFALLAGLSWLSVRLG